MKVSLNFVSDFVDVTGVDLATFPADVTKKIAEVERVTRVGCAIPGVVVGRILAIEPVPGADKIRLTTVTIDPLTPTLSHEGERGILKIVCGAQNIFEGAVVPVATLGTVLPGNFKIEKRKMKGIESQGMLCSTRELGLPGDASGIWILPENTPIGRPLSEVVPSDTVLEFDNPSLTHRPDLLGHLGWGRELALLLGKKFQSPVHTEIQHTETLPVEIREQKACSRYVGVRVSGVRVVPSPQKIIERLEACGVRAINNVVDATNYVMLELGQPLHAFDLKKVTGAQIIVRPAKAGEKLHMLDGTSQELNDSMLVIADGEKPIALAGVMGGANSEVDADTTEIILEAATFDAVAVRRTTQATGIRTEASVRFEKRLDPALPPYAVSRCIELLRETCPDVGVTAYADVYPVQPELRVIRFSLAAASRKLGREITVGEMQQILTALEFGVRDVGDDLFDITVPSFRAGRDIECADDITEELARHIGYDQLPTEFPTVRMAELPRDTLHDTIRTLAEFFVGCGFHEVCTLALTSERVLKNAGHDASQAIRLANPPSEDFRFLRQAVLPSVLDAAMRNARTAKTFRLFEIAKAFGTDKSGAVEQREAVALVVGEADVFGSAKGVVAELFAALHVAHSLNECEVAPIGAHPGRVAVVRVGTQVVGHVFEIHPAIAQAFELPSAAAVVLDVGLVAALPRSVVLARDVPKFPGVPRDLAVIVPARTLASVVLETIADSDERVHGVQLFDTYTGSELPAGTKSLAFSFEIIDPTKTLDEREVEEVMGRVIAAIEKTGGKLRS